MVPGILQPASLSMARTHSGTLSYDLNIAPPATATAADPHTFSYLPLGGLGISAYTCNVAGQKQLYLSTLGRLSEGRFVQGSLYLI